ncbi:MAG: tRNA 2-thiouridine(34) synthase MnmA, partial [Candidatus Omnitrophica bacterium]|nr:tRNA 2-thiouridine(34) synthase MnmA [Candidatus Omnitrophota bacterium]
MKVAVAMSGGVDSSVAAALLKKQGHEVIGITMCFNLSDASGEKPRCCGPQGIFDAKRVADILGISHYVLNFGDEMERTVIADFIREYRAGRTPNPCIRCNELIKFDALLNKALCLGADFLATGHYAGIIRKRGVVYLKKAADTKKDQSYFLYRLTQDKLKKILFPLGRFTKEKVRVMATRLKLPVAGKRESQEICFIPGKMQEFLKARLGTSLKPGPITDTQGVVIGTHKGVALYTIGQREGLGLARGIPVYVASLDPVNNTVVVGGNQELFKTHFRVKDLVFPSGPLRR